MSHSSTRGIPISTESCITAVHEQIARRLGETPVPSTVDRLIAQEVERMWAGRMKTFIPVLATRLIWDQMAHMGVVTPRVASNDLSRKTARSRPVRQLDQDTHTFNDDDIFAYNEDDIIDYGGTDTLWQDD